MSRGESRPRIATEPTAVVSVKTGPPAQLGRYRLCYEIAVGGMATVYLARVSGAAGFEKFVALKIIHSHLSRERTFVEMFLDEAKIASRITHPNVCTVFDFGLEQNVYYLAMEFLLGEPFLRLLEIVATRGKPEDLRRLPVFTARIIADACEGLHAAHELRGPDGQPLGIVHRDISPQNLFVTYEGSVKVVDFGVAKAAQRITQTDVGTVKGKVGYVAPEQVRSAGEVDRRADIWGLGVCLWEALTLRRLFRRESDLQTVMAVLEAPIATPRSLDDSIPEELDAIVMKALARNPDERYQTARELGRDLRRFIMHSGETADMAELAEYTSEVLSEDRARVMHLLEMARQAPMEASGPASVPAVASAVRTESLAPHGNEATGDRQAAAVTVQTRKPRERIDESVHLPGRGGPPILFWLILLAGLASGYYYLARSGRVPEGWPLRIASAPVEEEPGTGEEPTPTGSDEDFAAAPETAAPSGETVAPAAATAAPTEEDTSETDGDRRRDRRREEAGATAAPATAAPATADPDANGTLHIRAANGFATVYLGGRELGTTPFSVDLPPGNHQLRILPYGREPASTQTVTVLADTELRVSLNIRSEGGAGPTPDPTPEPPAADGQ